MSRDSRSRTAGKGLYRLELEGLGECARMLPSAGDAYPFIDRTMYEMLGFEPAYETLPSKADFLARQRQRPIAETRCERFWETGVSSPVGA